MEISSYEIITDIQSSTLPSVSPVVVGNAVTDTQALNGNMFGGLVSVVKNNFVSTSDPIATDDSVAGYAKGSTWINTTNKKTFRCFDATASAAIWVTDKVASTFSGTSITPSYESVQSYTYSGGSAQSISSLGTLASIKNGTKLTLIGSNNTNTISLAENDNTDGWLINGAWTGGRGSSITLEKNDTLSRWVEICRN
jgi:hypothetical protein